MDLSIYAVDLTDIGVDLTLVRTSKPFCTAQKGLQYGSYCAFVPSISFLLLLAPFETEQGKLAKVELYYIHPYQIIFFFQNFRPDILRGGHQGERYKSGLPYSFHKFFWFTP